MLGGGIRKAPAAIAALRTRQKLLRADCKAIANRRGMRQFAQGGSGSVAAKISCHAFLVSGYVEPIFQLRQADEFVTERESWKRMSTVTENISAAQVKDLREKTGRADDGLPQRAAGSQGRSGRGGRGSAQAGHGVGGQEGVAHHERGAVGTYIHAGGKIGVLIEMNCESDFRRPHRRLPGAAEGYRHAHRGDRSALHPPRRRDRRGSGAREGYLPRTGRGHGQAGQR